jgi:hypothetical protein
LSNNFVTGYLGIVEGGLLVHSLGPQPTDNNHNGITTNATKIQAIKTIL